MSQSGGTFGDLSMPANADLSAKVYLFVKAVTGGKLDVASTGERMLGILQNKPKSGEACTYRHAGTSKLVVDGNAAAIAVGDKLKSDSAGKGIKTTSDGDEVGAMALEASTAAGDIIEVQVLNRQV